MNICLFSMQSLSKIEQESQEPAQEAWRNSLAGKVSTVKFVLSEKKANKQPF